MKLHLVKNTTDTFFSAFWSLYEHAFPVDERRNLPQQKNIFKKNEYALFAIAQNNQFIGFLSCWNLGKFIFIEHFAVREELRGRGLGTKIMNAFIQDQKQKRKEIVLETEPPNANAAAKRGVRFYERLGFKICLENYIQPAYDANKKPVPLYLMRFEKEISKKEFEQIKKILYEIVYGSPHFFLNELVSP